MRALSERVARSLFVCRGAGVLPEVLNKPPGELLAAAEAADENLTDDVKEKDPVFWGKSLAVCAEHGLNVAARGGEARAAEQAVDFFQKATMSLIPHQEQLATGEVVAMSVNANVARVALGEAERLRVVGAPTVYWDTLEDGSLGESRHRDVDGVPNFRDTTIRGRDGLRKTYEELRADGAPVRDPGNEWATLYAGLTYNYGVAEYALGADGTFANLERAVELLSEAANLFAALQNSGRFEKNAAVVLWAHARFLEGNALEKMAIDPPWKKVGEPEQVAARDRAVEAFRELQSVGVEMYPLGVLEHSLGEVLTARSRQVLEPEGSSIDSATALNESIELHEAALAKWDADTAHTIPLATLATWKGSLAVALLVRAERRSDGAEFERGRELFEEHVAGLEASLSADEGYPRETWEIGFDLEGSKETLGELNADAAAREGAGGAERLEEVREKESPPEKAPLRSRRSVLYLTDLILSRMTLVVAPGDARRKGYAGGSELNLPAVPSALPAGELQEAIDGQRKAVSRWEKEESSGFHFIFDLYELLLLQMLQRGWTSLEQAQEVMGLKQQLYDEMKSLWPTPEDGGLRRYAYGMNLGMGENLLVELAHSHDVDLGVAESRERLCWFSDVGSDARQWAEEALFPQGGSPVNLPEEQKPLAYGILFNWALVMFQHVAATPVDAAVWEADGRRAISAALGFFKQCKKEKMWSAASYVRHAQAAYWSSFRLPMYRDIAEEWVSDEERRLSGTSASTQVFKIERTLRRLFKRK